jgi:hypothetical protein
LPIKVKDAATSAKKFATRAAAAAGDYAEGIRGSGGTWQNNSAAAAETYAAGVQDAISRNAFARGVQQAGGAKFEERAAGVGARRFPEGVRAAESDWAAGTAPFLQTIASLNLPPRRPKGDPANYQRSEAVGAALRARKLAR